jgi:hypothetical protein
MGYRDLVPFSILEGNILIGIDNFEEGAESLTFRCANGVEYWMGHHQDCCESVSLSDIVGDKSALFNTPIISACEETGHVGADDEPHTWTFYTIKTVKGTVHLRWYGESNGCWYGESNGYYSKSVDFERMGRGK